jgi:hypothetical protein
LAVVHDPHVSHDRFVQDRVEVAALRAGVLG